MILGPFASAEATVSQADATVDALDAMPSRTPCAASVPMAAPASWTAPEVRLERRDLLLLHLCGVGPDEGVDRGAQDVARGEGTEVVHRTADVVELVGHAPEGCQLGLDLRP
jgi:hypothetical protein